MTTKRTVKTRVDGVKQAYHVGKTAQSREAVQPPTAAAPAPLAPALKQDFSAEYNQFHAGRMIAGVEDLYDTMYGAAWREAPVVQESGFDNQGYDAAGLDIDGFDRLGFKDGLHKNGTLFDDASFDIHGNHQTTGGKYGPDSFNREGWNDSDRHRSHYDEDGYDDDNLDAFGINRPGFDGWTDLSDPRFDEHGFNENDRFGDSGERYNPAGFNVQGLSLTGLPRSAYIDGYDEDGFDPRGWDKRGFNQNRIHNDSWRKYDYDGFDFMGISPVGKPRSAYAGGFDEDGFDVMGRDKEGFNAQGLSRTGLPRSAYTDGYDEDGFDPRGGDRRNVY